MPKNRDEFKQVGVDSGMLGSHSTRKGAITLASSGCTISPSMASICIRAGWSMGPMKEWYMYYAPADDQFVGRSVTGIPSVYSKFAASRVYWDWSEGTNRVDGTTAVNIILEASLLGPEEVSPSACQLLRYLVAALVYHHEYLRNSLHASNPLLGSPAFIGMRIPNIRENAVVQYPWKGTEYTPEPTPAFLRMPCF